MLSDISLKLLAGKPIDISIGKVHALKLEDIMDISEQVYNQYLSLLLYDVDLLNIDKEALKEMQIDKLTTYHFLLLQSYNDDEFKNIVARAFQCFFKEKVGFDYSAFVFYLGDTSSTVRPITFEDYDLFRKILIKQNFLKELEEEENLIFGNDLAREWYLELKRKEKMQPKPKSNVDLHSIISAVMWKSNKTPEEIFKMTIYQLYDGYYRLSLIDSCNNLAQGISHGTIDQSKIKDSDLNWAKIIKFDK